MAIKKIVVHYLKHVLWVFREVAFRSGVWTPKGDASIEKAILAFIAKNREYWPRKVTSKQGILVEGHLSAYGPNYLFRTALAARAIHEKSGLDITVVYNGYSHQWVPSKKAYTSFGIEKSIFLGSYFLLLNGPIYLLSSILAFFYRFRLKCPEDILKIKYNNILTGDLIYDDVLKSANKKTITEIDRDVIKCISASLFYYYQYRLLFLLRSYSYFVSTHTAYAEYGLLCRVALMHGVKVIETSDIQMSCYRGISNDKLPTYHDGIRNSIVDSLKKSQGNLFDLRRGTKEALSERFDSKVKQLDAQKAYTGKVYSRDELNRLLGNEKEKQIVFVVAHIFTDAPHLSSGMLHADYYQWMLTTLEICNSLQNVHWVIKPHPSSFLYGEEGMIEKMVSDFESKHVSICPADLNTKSLRDCADAIVTVHGTAGLEFSCLGIPVVLAGKPFYSGFGFTIDASSNEIYKDSLAKLEDIKPLDSEQVATALDVYRIWNSHFDWDNPIVTSDVQARVWGSGVKRDVGVAYQILTENLCGHDPRQLKLWEFSQSVVD